MTQKEHTEGLIDELTQDIKDFEVEAEVLQAEIDIKNIELEALIKKRDNAINRRKNILLLKDDTVWNGHRQQINIGDTVEITNEVTRFSQ